MTSSGAPIETSPSGSLASDKTCRIVLTSGTTGDPEGDCPDPPHGDGEECALRICPGQPVSGPLAHLHEYGPCRGARLSVPDLYPRRGGTIYFAGDSLETRCARLRSSALRPCWRRRPRLPSCSRLVTNIHRSRFTSPPSCRAEACCLTHCSSASGRACARTSSPDMARPRPPSAQRRRRTKSRHIPGAAGYVTPGIRIEIVDEMDRAVPAGVEGIVRIASEFGVDRYIDDPIESAQVFRDGWFYPRRSRGSLTSDNLLMISGRQNDVLNAGGGKMAAEKVEAAVLSCKGCARPRCSWRPARLGSRKSGPPL